MTEMPNFDNYRTKKHDNFIDISKKSTIFALAKARA